MGYGKFHRNRLRVLDPDRARKLLRDTAAGSGWVIRSVDALEVAKEWTDRRLTVRYTVTAQLECKQWVRARVYGKLYRGQRGAAIHAAQRFLSTALTGFRTPQPLGYDLRRRFLLMTEVTGRPMATLLTTETPDRRKVVVDRLAKALAVLHSLPPDDRLAWRPHAAIEEVSVLAEAANRLQPVNWPADLQRFWDGCRTEASRRLVDGAALAPAILHRDLHPGQVLMGRDEPGLIDLDDISLGEPVLDVGNLTAHLLLSVVRGDAGSDEADVNRLLAGYAKFRPLDRERERVYRAAALLRLASLERLAAQGAANKQWPELARGLIHRAVLALTGD